MDTTKNYYRILRLGRNAGPEEIKKAFRKLAHEFHPDKNRDNAFAAVHFREIREAYQVLSRLDSRRAYDRERSRTGADIPKQPTITSAFLLEEVCKLRSSLSGMSRYRLDIHFLFASFQYLLSEQHLAILLQTDHERDRKAFTHEMFPLLDLLPYDLLSRLPGSLKSLVQPDRDMLDTLRQYLEKRRRMHIRDQVAPWLITLITILICLAMFWYGNRR